MSHWTFDLVIGEPPPPLQTYSCEVLKRGTLSLVRQLPLLKSAWGLPAVQHSLPITIPRAWPDGCTALSEPTSFVNPFPLLLPFITQQSEEEKQNKTSASQILRHTAADGSPHLEASPSSSLLSTWIWTDNEKERSSGCKVENQSLFQVSSVNRAIKGQATIKFSSVLYHHWSLQLHICRPQNTNHHSNARLVEHLKE